VIGLCAAYWLQKRGCRVTVLDAGSPGGACSKGNAGWIVPCLSGPVPAPGVVKSSLRWMLRSDSPLYIKPRLEAEFIRWLLTFWRHCNARDYRAGLEAVGELNRRTMPLYDELRASGVEFEMHCDGLLFAYRSAEELEHDLAGFAMLEPYGYCNPAPLRGEELHCLEPALADSVIGGYWFPQERHVYPESLMAGLVDVLLEDKVDLRTHTGVSGFRGYGRRIHAVEAGGDSVEADAVVVAAGAWTPAILSLVKATLPIEAGKGYSIDYAPSPCPIQHALYLHEARVAVTPLHGMTRLAGTMELSGTNTDIVPERVAALAHAANRYLCDWPIEETPTTNISPAWTGMRPLTPDGLPVIGVVPGFDNLVVASGHSMLGVTLGPATGEAVSELVVTGREPEVLRPFHPSRFL
jgi:D-amino-acid dehydrogenase